MRTVLAIIAFLLCSPLIDAAELKVGEFYQRKKMIVEGKESTSFASLYILDGKRAVYTECSLDRGVRDELPPKVTGWSTVMEYRFIDGKTVVFHGTEFQFTLVDHTSAEALTLESGAEGHRVVQTYVRWKRPDANAQDAEKKPAP